MSDRTLEQKTHTGDAAAECVALLLLQTIASAEGKTVLLTGGVNATADRKWVLDTYAECLQAVKGRRGGFELTLR